MILRGILDNSLGQLCIRGYAKLNNLEKISYANLEYQRNLIEAQEGEIRLFLENNPNLFFPEIILSYQLNYDYKKRGASSLVNPMTDIDSGIKFKSNVDRIEFIGKTVSFRDSSDSRGFESIRIVSIKINEHSTNRDESTLKWSLFLRIDGNHRLSAASHFKDSSIGELVCPYCLILLPPEHNSIKFEKTIFYNINSKSVALLPEEIHRIILDSDDFSDEEILVHRDFGKKYFDIRNFLKVFKPKDYNNLKTIFKEKSVDTYRTILIDLYTLINEISAEDINNFNENEFLRGFDSVDALYGTNPILKSNKNIGLLVSFMYFAITKKKFELDWFLNWIIQNRIYELKYLSSTELVNIFEKIIETKDRTIFVSMQFGNKKISNHYSLIEKIINEINVEKNANIKLQPLKIEDYKTGDAYLIPDKILEKIQETSLLIADLSNNNQNVYHEIGYKIAYNKAKGNDKFGLIIILNTTITPIEKIKFNVKHHKILPFEDTNEIFKELKEEILNYYFKA